MKKQRNWMGLAWGFVGLLVVSAVLMSLGKRDNQSFPSATSYSPSGTRALRELLESQGYEVHVETSTMAKTDPDALYIAFLVDSTASILDDPAILEPVERPKAGEEEGEFDGSYRRWEEQKREEVRPLSGVIKAGANALIVWLPDDFRAASRLAQTGQVKVDGPAGQSLLVSSDMNTYGPDPADMLADDAVEMWFSQGMRSAWAVAGKVKNSVVVESYNGLPFTNRFIDVQDNAQYAASLVNLAAKSKKIVFLEATIGNAVEPSVLATIGPWASGMGMQAFFLFVLLIVFGAVRFGLPDERRPRQSGTRELVDALGETYARTRSNHVGLRAIYDEYDRQVRSKLKLPADAGPSERNKLIPSSLAHAFATVQAMCDERGSERESINAAKVLQREVEDFLGRIPKPRMKKRKRS